jgi:hypothetical protein
MAPKGHFASWAIRATGLALKLSVLMLLDEFLSLGRVGTAFRQRIRTKRIHHRPCG